MSSPSPSPSPISPSPSDPITTSNSDSNPKAPPRRSPSPSPSPSSPTPGPLNPQSTGGSISGSLRPISSLSSRWETGGGRVRSPSPSPSLGANRSNTPSGFLHPNHTGASAGGGGGSGSSSNTSTLSRVKAAAMAFEKGGPNNSSSKGGPGNSDWERERERRAREEEVAKLGEGKRVSQGREEVERIEREREERDKERIRLGLPRGAGGIGEDRLARYSTMDSFSYTGGTPSISRRGSLTNSPFASSPGPTPFGGTSSNVSNASSRRGSMIGGTDNLGEGSLFDTKMPDGAGGEEAGEDEELEELMASTDMAGMGKDKGKGKEDEDDDVASSPNRAEDEENVGLGLNMELESTGEGEDGEKIDNSEELGQLANPILKTEGEDEPTPTRADTLVPSSMEEGSTQQPNGDEVETLDPEATPTQGFPPENTEDNDFTSKDDVDGTPKKVAGSGRETAPSPSLGSAPVISSEDFKKIAFPSSGSTTVSATTTATTSPSMSTSSMSFPSTSRTSSSLSTGGAARRGSIYDDDYENDDDRLPMPPPASPPLSSSGSATGGSASGGSHLRKAIRTRTETFTIRRASQISNLSSLSAAGLPFPSGSNTPGSTSSTSTTPPARPPRSRSRTKSSKSSTGGPITRDYASFSRETTPTASSSTTSPPPPSLVGQPPPRQPKSPKRTISQSSLKGKKGGPVFSHDDGQLSGEGGGVPPLPKINGFGGGEGGKDDSDELAILAVSAAMTELSMSIQEVNTLIFEIQELRHSTAGQQLQTTDYHDISSISPSLTPALSPPRNPSTPSRVRSAGKLSAPASDTLSDVSPLPEAVSDGREPPGPRPPSAPSEVDSALMRLDARLDGVALEFQDVEDRVAPLLAVPPPANGEINEREMLRRKRNHMVKEWESAQKDAEMLTEELREDRWLTVFRTVGQQADDMMESLEKVLTQSHQFVWDLTRETSSKSPSRKAGGARILAPRPELFDDPEQVQSLLSSFIQLHRSFHLKKKFYVPSCDRVLKILEKGISERSTRNGEVLRRFSDMKNTWKDLMDRMKRIESEMKSLENMLREAADGNNAMVAQDEPPRTPSRATDSSVHLSPPSKGGSPGKGDRNALSRTVSPFRKLASKMNPNRTRTPPSSGSTPSTPGHHSADPYYSEGTPSKPPRPGLKAPGRAAEHNQTLRMKKMASYGDLAGTARARRPASAAPPAHRHSTSVGTVTTSELGNSTMRSKTPTFEPASLAGKPKWNISTKRDLEDSFETLNASAVNAQATAPNSKRPPLPSWGGGSRSRTVSPSPNLSHSVGGSGFRSASRNRSASRQGAATSMGISRAMSPTAFAANQRSASPTLSTASFTTSGGTTHHRGRPMSPSRIPAPVGQQSPSRSATPFSSLQDEEPTSLLQRAMSPTPSTSAYSAAASSTPSGRARRKSSTSSPPSKIPQLSFTNFSPGTPAIPPMPKKGSSPSNSSHGGSSTGSRPTRNARSHTPEANLMAKAQRIGAIYQTPLSRSTPASAAKARVDVSSNQRLKTPAESRPPISSTRGLSKILSSSTASSSRASSRPPTGRRPSTSMSRSSHVSYPESGRSSPPLFLENLSAPPYEPTRWDPLDMEVAKIVNSQPLRVWVERIDPKLGKSEKVSLTGGYMAKYKFGSAGASMGEGMDKEKPVPVKVIERGKGGVRKTLVKIGGGWMDLELYLLGRQAEFA